MSKLQQMRKGSAKLICQDYAVGTVTRDVKIDNGRGSLISTGEKETYKVGCRVIDTVKTAVSAEAGLVTASGAQVLAFHDSIIEQGDLLEWHGIKYVVGVITRPKIEGGIIHIEAPLTEVK